MNAEEIRIKLKDLQKKKIDTLTKRKNLIKEIKNKSYQYIILYNVIERRRKQN